ncbi:MAG: GIY-YIG nuclease family protein [Actinomycetia bacterium]|jgi:hypothetical protein|nr:GIY-YIG nuclease family protein [Actinomycetes bacterium]MCH9737898.1 GIY-YIG nuclease family protein [Actinomycetes bacterium]MCH9841040.1 GIY-YIG nuclease family protein [Actinomycetes bacterium]
MPNVYKITYPNGKIYVGVDHLDQITYFGSVDPKVVAEDFTSEDRRDFTVRKQLLWESEEATREEARAVELEWIRRLGSNNPDVGYNRWPKWTATQA